MTTRGAFVALLLFACAARRRRKPHITGTLSIDIARDATPRPWSCSMRCRTARSKAAHAVSRRASSSRRGATSRIPCSSKPRSCSTPTRWRPACTGGESAIDDLRDSVVRQAAHSTFIRCWYLFMMSRAQGNGGPLTAYRIFDDAPKQVTDHPEAQLAMAAVHEDPDGRWSMTAGWTRRRASALSFNPCRVTVGSHRASSGRRRGTGRRWRARPICTRRACGSVGY